MDPLRLFMLQDFDFTLQRRRKDAGKPAIIEVSCTTTVAQTFQVLKDNNVLSVPVYDDSKKNKHKGEAREYLGFFDTKNVIELLLLIEDNMRQMKDQDFKLENVMKLTRGRCKCKTGKFIGSELTLKQYFMALGELMYPWYPVKRNAGVHDVVRLLKKTKRVAVIDPKTYRVVQVISRQLVVSTILGQKFDREADFYHVLPSESFGLKTVHSVTEKASVGALYRKMYDKRVSAIAIVDDKGVIKFCVSSRDIHQFKSIEDAAEQIYKTEQRRRLLSSDKLAYGAVSLPQGVGTGATEELWGKHAVELVKLARFNNPRDKAFAPIVVAPTYITLSDIASQLLALNIHRVFLVDDDKRPVGVVSAIDIINQLELPDPKPQAKSAPKKQNVRPVSKKAVPQKAKSRPTSKKPPPDSKRTSTNAKPKQTSKQPSKQPSKQVAKQQVQNRSSKQVTKQEPKRTSKQAPQPPPKQVSKQPAKQVSKQPKQAPQPPKRVSKQPAKQVSKQPKQSPKQAPKAQPQQGSKGREAKPAGNKTLVKSNSTRAVSTSAAKPKTTPKAVPKATKVAPKKVVTKKGATGTAAVRISGKAAPVRSSGKAAPVRNSGKTAPVRSSGKTAPVRNSGKVTSTKTQATTKDTRQSNKVQRPVQRTSTKVTSQASSTKPRTSAKLKPKAKPAGNQQATPRSSKKITKKAPG